MRAQGPIHLSSARDTVDLGVRMGRLLFTGAVVGLSGPMGAGKTTLARGIAEGMGIEEGYVVSSPTYTLMQVYPCGDRQLYHLDLYRIEGPEDLDSTGYRDAVGPGSALVVEWVERQPSVLPAENLQVLIRYGNDGRELFLLPAGERYEELVRHLLAGQNTP